MCGIVAITGGVIAGAGERVLAGLRHRGPDGSRSVQLDGCFLAMARLAILDPTARSDQPMSSGGAHLVYNGELYNFRALRSELSALGISFETTGDTEVVLKALIQWGVDACRRFSGMFAFAFWDDNRHTLIIGRDRYGVKPLYWRPLSKGGIAVASEVTPLAALEPVQPRMQAVREFLGFGSPISSCIYAEILEVEPGSTTVWFADGGCHTTAFDSDANTTGDGAAVLKAVSGEFLLSDRPVALFLSGGFDSAVVAAMTADSNTKPVALTLATSNNDQDVDRARTTASNYGLEHRILRVRTADVPERLGEFLNAMDQPTIDGFNTFLVSRAAVEAGFPVALSGLGGDEVMGGYGYYRWLRQVDLASAVWRHVPSRAKAALAAAGGKALHRRPSDMAAILGANSLPGRHRAWRALFTGPEVARLTGGNAEPSLRWLCNPEDQAKVQLSRLDFGTYLQPTLLRDTDVFSMANSVEVRVPLLDVRFASAMLGAERPSGKAAFAKSLGDSYLSGLASKAKLTFALPWAEWIGLMAAEQAELIEGRDPWHGLIDPAEAQRMLAEPTDRLAGAMRSWALLVLAVWLARSPSDRQLSGHRL